MNCEGGILHPSLGQEEQDTLGILGLRDGIDDLPRVTPEPSLQRFPFWGAAFPGLWGLRRRSDRLCEGRIRSQVGLRRLDGLRHCVSPTPITLKHAHIPYGAGPFNSAEARVGLPRALFPGFRGPFS